MESREFKTSQEQWKVVVEFMEEHPTILRGKFRNVDGDHEEFKRLWEELSIRLNSMGLGARSADKWQLAVGRWKSKTKAKASQLKMESEKTGGGPAKVPPLNLIEERLMALIGWRSVTGDRNVELGLPPLISAVAPSTSRAQTPSPSSRSKQPEQIGDIPALAPIRRHVPQPTTEVTTAMRENTKRTKQSIRFTSEKSKKMVTLSQMHKETQQRLTAIEKNTQIMARALQSIDVIYSGMGALLWLILIVSWITVFQINRSSWGEFADRISFIIPLGTP